MRVTAGKYRRLPLQSTPSPKVRPTARRLREALFGLLATRIEGARFLDLCAGSGVVGIEALSRGAQYVTFVERSPKISSFVKTNLSACGVAADQAEVLTCEAATFLRRTNERAHDAWDIAFLDPPYAADYAPVLELFGQGLALKRPYGVLVVEHYCENRLQETVGVIRRWRIIRQGESCLSFYERKR